MEGSKVIIIHYSALFNTTAKSGSQQQPDSQSPTLLEQMADQETADAAKLEEGSPGLLWLHLHRP
jgi:hypothetical protein